MLKRTILIALSLLFAISISAQNEQPTVQQLAVQETSIQMNDITIPAFTITLQQDEDLVKSIFKQQLKEWKISTTSNKGYTIAKTEVISNISSSPINFYAKIDEQGRRSNKTTVVTFAAVSSNLSADQASLNHATQQALLNFAKRVVNHEAEAKIADAESRLAKAVKTAAATAAVIAAIDKDDTKTQSKIDSKKKEIEKLQAKIDKLQQEIADQEASIQKNATKKAEYEQKASTAQQEVDALNATLDQYRSVLQK